eukprot:7008492-Lingulodinium_polyedra.AAC.1
MGRRRRASTSMHVGVCIPSTPTAASFASLLALQRQNGAKRPFSKRSGSLTCFLPTRMRPRM